MTLPSLPSIPAARLGDPGRRGLRTAIDVLLSAATSGLLLLLYNVIFDPDMTAAAYATLTAALTPVLSTIKNEIEDKTESSLIVAKQRPDPDPVVPDSALIAPTEEEISGSLDESLDEPEPLTLVGDGNGEPLPPIEGQCCGGCAISIPDGYSTMLPVAPVPSGMVLIAVEPDAIDQDDVVVGTTMGERYFVGTPEGGIKKETL